MEMSGDPGERKWNSTLVWQIRNEDSDQLKVGFGQYTDTRIEPTQMGIYFQK